MTRAYFDFVGQEGAAFRLIFESDLANDPEVRRRLDRSTSLRRGDGRDHPQ